MIKIRNKKGVELSMNVIIIAILVILVLVIVAVFFTGGVSSLISRIKGIVGTQTIGTSQAILACNNYCSSYDTTKNSVYKNNFCGGEKFDIDTNGDNKVDRPGQTCSDLGVTCQAIPPSECTV